MSYHPDFAEQINSALAHLDRSPSWLAQRLGVNPSTVSRWLNQDMRPGDPGTVVRIADILGLSAQVQELLVAAGYGYVDTQDAEPTTASAERAAVALPPQLDSLPPEEATTAHDAPVQPPHNLPLQMAPLFGRAEDLAVLTGMLERKNLRLVTLIGPGGVGKTSLAQQVGRTVLDACADGVFFVSLAPLRRNQDMITAIAEALDFTFQPDARTPRRQLLDYLQRKQVLLILDNLEHLLDGIDLVRELLETCADLRVLATSRQRLGLTGEAAYLLEGLSLGDEEDIGESDAVRFFLHRAQLVRAGYRPSPEDLLHIGRICRLVQGSPLSILLATTWMEMLSPAEIAAQITQDLDFLEADLYDLPNRQRSLRAIFDRSWTLLTVAEQQGFARLTVFQGSFDLDAAQQIAEITLRHLMALVSKSLLVRLENGRFEIHEMLRRYGAEQLARDETEQQQICARHAAYYLTWLENLTPDLYSDRQAAVMADIDGERENARLAWEWATQERWRDLLVEAAPSIGRYLEWYGRYRDGVDLLQPTTAALATDDSIAGLHAQAQVMLRSARFLRLLDKRSEAEVIFGQVESLLARLQQAGEDVRYALAALLRERAEMLRISDKEAAFACAGESMALYEAIGDQVGLASILFIAGVLAFELYRLAEAGSLLRRNLAISSKLGGPREIAYALSWLAYTITMQGRTTDLEPLVRESYELFQLIGDRAGLARSLRDLGGVYGSQGNFAEAGALFERSRQAYDDLGDRFSSADTQRYVIGALLEQGKYDEAHRQALDALHTARQADHFNAEANALIVLGKVCLVENRPQDAYAPLKEAVEIFEAHGENQGRGIVYFCLALAARMLGRTEEARSYMIGALQITLSLESLIPMLLNSELFIATLFYVDMGEVEKAIELDASICTYLRVGKIRWGWDIARRHVATIAAHLPMATVAQAEERGHTRAIRAVVADLLDELKQATDEST